VLKFDISHLYVDQLQSVQVMADHIWWKCHW